MTRLLLVGCGAIAAAAHLPALKVLQDEGLVEVVVADIDADKARAAAARFGMTAAADWRAAAAGVDAVAAILPPGVNAQVSTEAAAMGLHVLCEKPPGRDVEQARAMADAAASHPDRTTMIGFNRRFNPLYAEATERSRPLGPPTSFYGRVSGANLGKPPADGVADWLSSAGSHALDLAVATMGFPRAAGVDRRVVGGGPDNVWSLQLHCPTGSALLFFHFAAGRRTEHYEWAGATYDVRLDLPKDGDFAAGNELHPLSRTGEFHEVNGFTGEYRAFLAAIAGGPAPACDFAYGVRFMTLVSTLLSAAPASLTPVEVEVEVDADGEVPAGAPAGARGTAVGAAGGRRRTAPATERPIVVLHQPVAAHPRFFTAGDLSALHQRCDVRVMGGEERSETLRPARVIVTGRTAKALSNDLGEAPDLGLVVVIGASVRSVDADKLVDRGVVVANTADAVAQSVAEHCLMVTLAGLRRLTLTDQRMHAGEWPRPGQRPSGSRRQQLNPRQLVRRLPIPPGLRRRLGVLERRLMGGAPGTAGGGAPKAAVATGGPGADLGGLVVGLVGWGHTARRFTELLVPFGCQVLVASGAADPAELEAAGARRASVGEILGAARVVSLHKGLTDATRGFLDAGLLDRLRPGTVLVNTARGELIDEPALVARLAKGDIVAALDVFATEPLPTRHPLRDLPNVILTPHHASTTEQEERRMGAEALATVHAWLDGDPVGGLSHDRLGRMT
ncbi:MAG: D-3-phosphoglycerate dehydrogenase / 2-oxoglutarate reductase [Actinomycetota bacterium]|nr:D-3-phosphoglycerate dehydrogenase / 2-oxoglutarate reductase [Actinomycetota bacterium]